MITLPVVRSVQIFFVDRFNQGVCLSALPSVCLSVLFDDGCASVRTPVQ